MAIQEINRGNFPNDSTADTAYDGTKKINDNFAEHETAIVEIKAELETVSPVESPTFATRIDLEALSLNASFRQDVNGKLGWFVGTALAADGAQKQAAAIDPATGRVQFLADIQIGSALGFLGVAGYGSLNIGNTVNGGIIRFGDGTHIGRIMGGLATGVLFGSETDIDVVFNRNSTEAFRIGPGNRIGVGVTSPTSMLDVAGAATFTLAGYCYTEVNSGTVKGQLAANAGGSVDVRAVSNHPLCFYTNNVLRGAFTAAGFFGIGTSTPSAPLHVNAGDGQNVLLNGLTKGIRFVFGPGTSTIEGVDNTGSGSYQPLTLGGSVVIVSCTISPSAHNSFDLGATTARWKKLWAVDAEFTNSPLVPDVTVGDSSQKAANTKFVTDSLSVAGIGPGAIVGYQMKNAPSGWLKANGAAVSLTTYPGLLAIYVGDADNPTATSAYRCTNPATPTSTRSTTGGYIVLPDYRGEFMRGWDDARGIDSGRVIWSAQSQMFETHTHELTAYAAAGSFAQTGASIALSNVGNTAISAPKSGTFGAETRPRNLAALVCVKY